ncbi:hypothetical protein [Krasilnikovia sp. MM14-A1259]|uniref:hypothetical protein n=1 Tax=Krasilnikovia sp. MM14-A1259 TaxID=3373539 RepID=UPI00399CA0B9
MRDIDGRGGLAGRLLWSWWPLSPGVKTGLGAAAVLALMVGVGFSDQIGRWLNPPLISYRVGETRFEVDPVDGCLADWQRRQGHTVRKRSDYRSYCGWSRAAGGAAWVPATKEFLRLDAQQQHAVEVVAFGMLPDDAQRVRYILPGGEVVEAAAQHRDDLDHPAYWIHLDGVQLPVDLRTTGGRAGFAGMQVFDGAGQMIPVAAPAYG